jgi:hypothetical protein
VSANKSVKLLHALQESSGARSVEEPFIETETNGTLNLKIYREDSLSDSRESAKASASDSAHVSEGEG